MTDTQALRDFIIQAVREAQEPLGPVTGGTVLLGKNAVMSSLALVGLLVQIEDYCREHGLRFSWVADSAMSGKNSPFRTVDALVAHVAAFSRDGEDA